LKEQLSDDKKFDKHTMQNLFEAVGPILPELRGTPYEDAGKQLLRCKCEMVKKINKLSENPGRRPARANFEVAVPIGDLSGWYAFLDYSDIGPSGGEYNGRLRSDGAEIFAGENNPPSDNWHKKFAALKSCFGRNLLVSDCVLYRGVGPGAVTDMFIKAGIISEHEYFASAECIERINRGEFYITTSDVQSCSLNSHVSAQNFGGEMSGHVLMKIEAPKGAPALDLIRFCYPCAAQEHEVTLSPGTKLLIMSFSKYPDGHYVLEMKIILPDLAVELFMP
jgi:hypothetical protein